MATAKRLFLLDGMALVYRAYYALIGNFRRRSDGFNTSAIFGFTATLVHILETQKPTHIAVAFDTPEPTRRHLEFPEYKAQREAVPEDIIASLPHIRRVIEAFNIPVLARPGFEADDVIGTLVKWAEKEGFESYMVTPDKDFAQLVSEHTHIYKPGRSGSDAEIMGVPEVLKKWGVQSVAQVIDILGLQGDKSDNIPGIPGFGEKTAQKLIDRFGSVEALIEHVNELTGSQRNKVEQYADQARLSKRLATIDCDVPLDSTFDALRIEDPDRDRLTALFAEFEFRTLARRLLGDTVDTNAVRIDASTSTSPDLFDGLSYQDAGSLAAPTSFQTIADVEHHYQLVSGREERRRLVDQLNSVNSFCFDTETTSRDVKIAELVGIAFSFAKHSGYYVPVPADTRAAREILEQFRVPLENPEIEKIGHNLKFDISVLRWHGIHVQGRLRDTMLAHCLIAPSVRPGLDALARKYLSYAPIPISQLIGEKGKTQGNMRDVAVDTVKEYAVEDADITWQLHTILFETLGKEKLLPVYDDVENPLIRVLAAMEVEGVQIDSSALAEYSQTLTVEISELEQVIWTAADRSFNIDSPKQLGEILFDHLKLEAKAKRTRKSRQYNTSEQVLTRLAPRHKIVRDVLEYRSLRKLKNTYVDTLPAEVFKKTGRVHTTYNQAVAATGRLQSQSPNLQNIPIRTERGREIRKAFVPKDDNYSILSADYSQIELRIIASLSGDGQMADAFVHGLDIHQSTAAKIFGVALDDVTPEMRRKSKMVNFGIAYGISAFGLSQRLDIPRKEAKFIIDQYFEQFPGIRSYMDSTIQFARDHGYVETMMGRRRYLQDINSRNATIRNASERVAINAPIQGTAADMIKLAMIHIHDAIDAGGFRTRMLMQVHDELVFELDNEEEHTFVPIIKDKMEHALPLKVPVIVDIGIGRNWLEAH